MDPMKLQMDAGRLPPSDSVEAEGGGAKPVLFHKDLDGQRNSEALRTSSRSLVVQGHDIRGESVLERLVGQRLQVGDVAARTVSCRGPALEGEIPTRVFRTGISDTACARYPQTPAAG